MTHGDRARHRPGADERFKPGAAGADAAPMTDQVLDASPWLSSAEVDGPRLGDGSYGFADRSQVQEMLATPAEAAPPLRLWHSLLPRLLTALGALAGAAVLGNATVTALRESDWEQPRPLLEPRLGAAVALMMFGGLWWAVAAAANARRLTQRHVVGAATVLFYALPVGAWFAVDRFVEGDTRRWAWVAWVGFAVVVHYFVAMAYRSTSATLGHTNTHLTAVAFLPMGMAATSVPSVFQQAAVFALPMAAGFTLWLVAELWQAMTEWDRLCKERSRELRGLPVLGGPVVVAPVFSTASAAAAAAEASTSGAMPSAATVMAARADVAAEKRYHHTTLPRLMVVSSFVLGLSMPLWIWLLERKHHVQLAGRDTVFDLQGRRALAALFVSMLGSYAIGWLWWSVAAASNAANRARWAISPFLAPFGYAVAVGMVAAVPEINARVDARYHTAVGLGGAFIAAVAHLGVLTAYRSTAEKIGAPLAPWTRVIFLPQGALVFSVLLAFFGQMLNDTAFAAVLGGAWVLVYLVYAISFYQAMAGFDRACSGRRLGHAGGESLPDFLKRKPASADVGS